MSSSRCTAVRVLHLRVKDKHAKGATRGDCALHLPVQAVQEIAEEYARRRRQHQKIRLAWRKSGGARRSLGWIPFKVRTIRYRGGQIYFAGRWLSLWDSYGLGNFELRAGNFSEDSTVCEAVHDRNVNAAHIILAAGHRRLAEGILGP
jgi:hypothetical protein